MESSTDKKAPTFALKPLNKIPGLNLNFAPPKCILQKLANNEPVRAPLTSKPRTSSNNSEKSFEEMLQTARPIDIAKRLNFSHLSDLRNDDTPKSEANTKMETDQHSDTDEEIDLTHCIITQQERDNLIKMDEERRLSESSIVEPVDNDMKQLKIQDTNSKIELENIKINVAVRSKSPPRPRLPCLFEDFDYYTELHSDNKVLYETKMKNHKVTGIAKVISYEIPVGPVPAIDFEDIYGLAASTTVKRFKFDTPSPDELYLMNLEKNKDKKKKPNFLVP